MSRNDYDYRELLQDYGNEYLQEYYPDDCIYEMDMVTEFITDVWEALRSAFFGYDWAPGADSDHNLREQFNPNKDYFAFNGYGNLVSIDSYYYVDWLDRCITESEFVDWCVERGYLDEEDEEEIEGVSGVRVDNEWGANEMYLNVMNVEYLYNKYRAKVAKFIEWKFTPAHAVERLANMLKGDIKNGNISLYSGMGRGEQARKMAASDIYKAFAK